MIVICTKCHAKFRIADERVGPRGAKVRCSRCRTVFMVSADAGSVPLPEPAPSRAGAHPVSEPPAARAAPAPTPPAAAAGPPPLPSSAGASQPLAPSPAGAAGGASASASGDADPFAAAPEPDPFAAAQRDPFAADPFAQAARPSAARAGEDLAGEADPFAAPGADPFGAPGADPFAAHGDPFAARGDDPFAAHAADPFAPGAAAGDSFASSPGAGGPDLPVTSLEDILGAATPAGVARPGGGTPDAPAAPLPDPSDIGISLEERTTPPPVPVAARGPGADAFLDIVPGGAGSFDLGAYEPLPGDGDALALATDEPAWAEGPAPSAEPPPEPRLAAPPAGSSARAPPTAAAEPPPAAPAAPETRIPGARGSRLRAIAVNAVALAALLVAALAILVVWRTEGPLGPASLRPAAILGALRTARAPGPFAALDLRSGLYDRDKGPPVLFVRGNVVSRAAAPVPGVRVAIEVVRAGKVIARGEALAGAVPTAEELHRATDPAALAALAAPRAPPEVRPGDTVPFLVAIADRPEDLEGAAVRVELAATGGAVP